MPTTKLIQTTIELSVLSAPC